MSASGYYTDKVVLITGATSGIGRALGEKLCREGAHVVFTGRRIQLAQDIVERVSHNGGDAEAAKLDVTDPHAVDHLVNELSDRLGRLDILINNAGMSISGEICDLELEHWQRVIDVNLMGVIHGIQSVYPMMVKQRHGQIVNVSSLAGLIGYPTNTPYAATKSAIVTISNCLRLEAEAYGVRVNVVCPGYVETEILEISPVINADEAKVRKRLPFKPMAVDTAARVILKGLRRNRAVIAFPQYSRVLWRLYRLQHTLLTPLGRKIVHEFRASKLQ